MTGSELRPTALEIALGHPLGEHEAAYEDVAAIDDDRLSPLAALEEATLPALRRAPCLVSFSGGRDSSAVLAAAARAARRTGLAPPIPVTVRIPDVPETDEAEWQERVVAHLGLDEWKLEEVGEEIDFLGPVSAEVLRRHGVLWPPNAFLHLRMLRATGGGSLLTGLGGDELFDSWPWRHISDLLARRRRPVVRDLLRLAYAASPRWLRRVREARLARPSIQPWLRPEAARLYIDHSASAAAKAPRFWPGWIDWFRRRRPLAANRWSLELLARDAGALVVNPLLDPGFLATLATSGGRFGFGDRTAAMRTVFGEILPDATLTRVSKASWSGAYWRRHTGEFAERWTGGGVDQRLIDPEALRSAWLSPSPDIRSVMPMQSAWLQEQGGGASPPADATARARAQ